MNGEKAATATDLHYRPLIRDTVHVLLAVREVGNDGNVGHLVTVDNNNNNNRVRASPRAKRCTPDRAAVPNHTKSSVTANTQATCTHLEV